MKSIIKHQRKGMMGFSHINFIAFKDNNMALIIYSLYIHKNIMDRLCWFTLTFQNVKIKSVKDYSDEMIMAILKFDNKALSDFNTVFQQKGPLVGYENRKFPKPFQGCLGMLVGPPPAQKFWPRLHRSARMADFKCYFWLF